MSMILALSVTVGALVMRASSDDPARATPEAEATIFRPGTISGPCGGKPATCYRKECVSATKCPAKDQCLGPDACATRQFSDGSASCSVEGTCDSFPRSGTGTIMQ